MSRKHFIRFAETIKQIADLQKRREQAEFTAQLCIESNPRFDKRHFFAACGVDDKTF